MFIQSPMKQIYRNAEGAGSGGGEPAAAGEGSTPAPAAAAPAAPSGDAMKVNDALAAAGSDATNTNGDKKPEGDAGKDGEGQPKEGDNPAPQIEYTDFTVPTDFNVIPEALEAAKNTFKEIGLPQEQAQKVVDAYFEIQRTVDAAWVKDIEGQYEAFSKNAEFYKDGKLTPVAEQAYGKVRNQSAETKSFYEFLNKNGGLFHPGFAQIVKGYAASLGEGQFVEGKQAPAGDAAKSFYSKSNHE